MITLKVNTVTDKEMFDFSDYLTKLKYYDNLNKLVFGKVKRVRLNLKMYSY